MPGIYSIGQPIIFCFNYKFFKKEFLCTKEMTKNGIGLPFVGGFA